MGWGMMYGWGNDWNVGSGGWISVIFIVVILGLIIWGAIALIRYLGRSHYRSHYIDTRDDAPLGILNRRYARGEITKKEYEERKRDLI